ncbi:MAG TPA: ATP-dependent 6-phosphofructokinase [Microthrixaceae bacterium]|nr:ATP-dependent 6-phosphofructokinase [Microthrixaceae bacterium]
MSAPVRRLAINTGGGDAPGLNATIRGAVLGAIDQGWDVIGIRDGYEGLFHDDGVVELHRDVVRDVTNVGGTILGTTNRGNPFETGRGEAVVQRLRELGVDIMVAIGGDGSLTIGHKLSELGMPVIGVPKTIDNDLEHTDQTPGFDSAVSFATECIDRLVSTTTAHDRIMVIEVMGRTAGWIALYSGIAGAAHAILIPEIPYDIEVVAQRVRQRAERGQDYSIVVVAEGAKPIGGSATTLQGTTRLGGVSQLVAEQLEELTGKEARWSNLGHLLRGGSPTADDRLLGLRYGSEAIRAIVEGHRNVMIALRDGNAVTVPLSEVADRARLIPDDDGVLRTARAIGICLGEPGRADAC